MAARFAAATNEDETVERLEGARAWALLKGTRTNGQLAIGRLALPAGSATSVRTDTGQDTAPVAGCRWDGPPSTPDRARRSTSTGTRTRWW